MDPIAVTVVSAFVTIAVTGFVELVRRLFKQDWEGVTIIAGSAVVGGLAGFAGIDGLTVANGIACGLAASGLITAVKSAGAGLRV